jgi:hypothetical protein
MTNIKLHIKFEKREFKKKKRERVSNREQNNKK